MKIINGQRKNLEKKISDLVLNSFKSGSNVEHDFIMSQIERLEPQGKDKISLVSQQTSLPHCEK
jgi:hypothetical protein